jgi:hypothetical protein
MSKTKSWILKKIDTKMGKKHGLPIYKLTFVDPETMMEYEMIVDEAMRNYNRCGWNNILNSDEPYGIYTGLRVKPNEKSESRKPVLTADSRVTHEMNATQSQAEELVRKLKNQREVGNVFDSLFEEQK